MGTKAKEMGALAVSRIDRRGANFVGGVAGLAINVTSTGNKSWIFRYQRGGRRRDLGLGGYPDVPLAAARDAARQLRWRGNHSFPVPERMNNLPKHQS